MGIDMIKPTAQFIADMINYITECKLRNDSFSFEEFDKQMAYWMTMAEEHGIRKEVNDILQKLSEREMAVAIENLKTKLNIDF